MRRNGVKLEKWKYTKKEPNKPKRKRYLVYSRTQFTFHDEIGEMSGWRFEGETYAASENHAINNVRHRNYGDEYSSQYKPVFVDAVSDTQLDRYWKAEEEEGE